MAPQPRKAAPRRAAIVGGNRIPFARSNSKYAQASNQDMLTTALDGLVARFGLQGQQVGEVVAGAAPQHARDLHPTPEAGPRSQVSATPPAHHRQPAGGRRPAGAARGAHKNAP